MSSSRSDDVTKTVCVGVCVSGVILFIIEHSKHKHDVLRELRVCLRGVYLKFRECLMEVSLMWQRSFKDDSRKVYGSLKGVSTKLQECFKEV